jgi:uncharacterized protein (TIGR02118 family)
MYKVAWISRFSPASRAGDARRHWSGPHAALAAAVPGLDRYVQNHPTARLGLVGPADDRAAFDCYDCGWFADRAAFGSAITTAEWAALESDAVGQVDVEWGATMTAAVDERTIIDGPTGPFKAVWIVRFRDEIRADPDRVRDAHDYWTRTHGGAFGVRVPGIDRYVQNHVVGAVGTVDPGFDGFSECWFQDRAAFDVTMASQEWDDMNGDAPNLFDMDFILGGMSAILDEVVVRG